MYLENKSESRNGLRTWLSYDYSTSKIKPENGGVKPYTYLPDDRRPEVCIWIDTDVHKLNLTYFLTLFIRYSLLKGRPLQCNNCHLFLSSVCVFFVLFDRIQ